MRRFNYLFGALLMAVMLHAAPQASPAQPRQPEFKLAAPDMQTVHAAGTENGMLFKEYTGKPVLLNFFGKHCKYCMLELPHLVALKQKYGDKIQIVGIHVQETMTQIERGKMQKRFGFNYPVYEYENNAQFVRYISARAQWQGGIPFSILFGKQGNVLQVIPGYADKPDLERMIDFALKQNPS